jgi:hypothetical protein
MTTRVLATSAMDGDIVGAYTPVTKRLWLERLNWSSKLLADAPLAKETVPKLPKAISVTYPLTTDKALSEMVSVMYLVEWCAQYARFARNQLVE